MLHKCKETVLKRGCDTEPGTSFPRNPGNSPVCDQVKGNQEVIIVNPYKIPKGNLRIRMGRYPHTGSCHGIRKHIPFSAGKIFSLLTTGNGVLENNLELLE